MFAVTAATQQDSNNAIARLTSLVSEDASGFLRPTLEFQKAALEAAKVLLDPLATNIANTQIKRRDENRKKRKRGEDEEEQPVLQIRQVYTKGFGVKQVWEQAKRILDAAEGEIEKDIQIYGKAFAESGGVSQHGVSVINEDYSLEDKSETDDDEITDEEQELSELEGEDEKDYNDDILSGDENVEADEDIEADSDVVASDIETPARRETYIQDPNGLNDGFFSIDDFNKQSQFLEQMDALGDDDNPSDEDEIDWDANPLATTATNSQNVAPNGDADDESLEDGAGPTFGDADSDEEDEDMLDGEDQDLDVTMGGGSNANEVYYKDFFEPPPKKPSKNKRMRALPKTQPPKKPDLANENSDVEAERLQNDLERAIADVRRDLLDSDEEDLSEQDEDVTDDERGPQKSIAKVNNMSTHEKQRAAIAAEIRELEAASVAKRDWQLSGEARAADRPVNSLIEEDLEFERAGKPIAPVTAETTDEIDALIKRRILAREFDEVVRRVSGSLNLASETRRGRIELDDSKPQASLGEIYEAEHQKNADPLSYIDKRSAATKKAHAEIELLWKQVRDQLDLLSNMHFKPKRADVEIKTVEDKPRIAMEDARPVGEIESGEGGMLAPQEVYRPGIDSRRSKDEVTLQGGAAMSKEEMSREEKLRRRRREKERTKKAQNNKEVQVLGRNKPDKKARKNGKEVEKANIIDELKRGGVKVVGKGGELQSIGKQKKGQRGGGDVIASNLKL